MRSKKKIPTSPSTSQQALKIGSRVRCTDDGVEGRIVWANALAVKIQWDDGEHVTWRRDALASRPIAILAASGDEDQQASPAAPEQTVRTEPPPPCTNSCTHGSRSLFGGSPHTVNSVPGSGEHVGTRPRNNEVKIPLRRGEEHRQKAIDSRFPDAELCIDRFVESFS
jgi:hypothetical protein